MRRSRKVLLFLLLGIVLLPLAWLGWRLWYPLPQYDGQIKLPGLEQPVRVLRDDRGVPHLYAENLEDLLFAQGYVHAQERLWQMDWIRRTARGRLSEIMGTSTVELDKENRRLGLGTTADRAAETLDQESLRQLQAYARGVNAYLEHHRGHFLLPDLPVEFDMLRYHPEPWQPADTLVIGLHMFRVLYNTWPHELARAKVTERVGRDRAADLFVSHSDQDRPIAQPIRPRLRPRRERVFIAGVCQHPLASVLAQTREGLGAQPPLMGASNNWVVAGSRTRSGQAMLANDTHLPHTVPSIWFINHLKSPEVDVIGFSLPGVPWVIMGHNGRIAWGVTNLMADTQDLFVERFDPADPSRYMTPTGWQNVQRRMEHIQLRGGGVIDFEVLETRHGPIVHEDGPFKLALAWTARDPRQLAFPFLAINQADNWDEFNHALQDYGGPPQNFVYADAEGNIGYHAAGRIPLRRTGRGQVPVPGDGNLFDWVEYLPFEDLPQTFLPASNHTPEARGDLLAGGEALATANNRVVSETYPYYLTDRWMDPSRIARIYELLQEERKFVADDFLRIQGDIVSLPDRFLAGQLLAAAETVSSHPPERAQALGALRNWDGAVAVAALAPLITDAARRHLLEQLLRPHLGDDWNSYSWWMSPVFLQNVLGERPQRWLPPTYQSYEQLLLAVLDSGLQEILRDTRAPSLERLRWGEQMRVHFAHPIGDRLPLLRRWFSRAGEPQAGGRYTVKQTGRRYGPSQRFVLDFADLDATLMNVTLGQSGHVASRHYQDQFKAWYELRSFPTPFSDAAVQRTARHSLHLLP